MSPPLARMPPRRLQGADGPIALPARIHLPSLAAAVIVAVAVAVAASIALAVAVSVSLLKAVVREAARVAPLRLAVLLCCIIAIAIAVCCCGWLYVAAGRLSRPACAAEAFAPGRSQ